MRLWKLRHDLRCRTNEIVVTFQSSQFANAADQQTIRRQSHASQKLCTIESISHVTKTIDINPVGNNCNLIFTEYALASKFFCDCTGHSNHTLGSRERVTMNAV